MEDIEDMFKNEGDQIEARLPETKRKIIKKVKKVAKKQEEEGGGEEAATASCGQKQCEGGDQAAPGT